jgi:hypothetical protein
MKMKRKEIADALLKCGAACDGVEDARAVGTGKHKGTDIDLTLFFQGAAKAFGIAYLAITGELDEDLLEPARVLAAMAKNYLAGLEGGEDE